MKMYFRPLAPGETDVELLGFWVALAAATVGWGWLHWQLPLPECVVAKWIGLPCPTCGGTRLIRALLAGDGWAAWRLNPLVLALLSAGALFFAYSAAVLLFRLRRVRLGKLPEKLSHIIRGGALLLLLANWIYLVCTLPVGREARTYLEGRRAMHLDVVHLQ